MAIGWIIPGYCESKGRQSHGTSSRPLSTSFSKVVWNYPTRHVGGWSRWSMSIQMEVFWKRSYCKIASANVFSSLIINLSYILISRHKNDTSVINFHKSRKCSRLSNHNIGWFAEIWDINIVILSVSEIVYKRSRSTYWDTAQTKFVESCQRHLPRISIGLFHGIIIVITNDAYYLWSSFLDEAGVAKNGIFNTLVIADSACDHGISSTVAADRTWRKQQSL